MTLNSYFYQTRQKQRYSSKNDGFAEKSTVPLYFSRHLWAIVLIGMSLCLSSISHGDVITADTFRLWGQESMAQIETDFARWDDLYSHSVTDTDPDFAWGQGVMLNALTVAAKVDSFYLERARNNADEFHARYWCTQDGTSGYNASYGNCGDRYYDDNAWIALALVELYELTENSTYLDWAQETVAFSMTGENGPGDIPDGGIRWHESNTGGASICSTAPTCLGNLMIYQATGIESYLIDGMRLYDWLITSEDYRYSSGIFHETNQGPLGYQTAVVTQTAVRLYQIHGDVVYLQEAQWMAAAMEDEFINSQTHVLNQTGKWGGHDMTNAYVDLYEVDYDPYWLELAAGYLEYLHINCKDAATGLYPEAWNDTSGNYSEGLIDNASVARAYWKMASTVLTPPDPATNPNPADTATGVSLAADISWNAGAGATSHDVYFGTDPTPDNDGGSSEFIDNRTGTSYDPGTLLLGTTYYWAIDEVNGVGTTPGPVWSFTTNYPVDLEEFALLAQYWMADCGDVDDCIAADWYFDGTINILDLQQLALSWLGEAIYAFKPISYWDFDEQSGSSAADSIGENDGTLIDFPIDDSQWTDGKVDGALSFDGIDDWVSTAYAGISGAAARTTCAWFKCDGDIGNHQAIFSYGGASGSGNAWRVWLCRDTGAIINAMNGGNANGDTTGLWDGQWHHVAVTFPAGGTHIEDVKIYVDGSEEITWYTNGDTQIVNTAAEDAFEIGMATGGTQFPFEGNIDDVRVYDSELTDAEILALSVMGD